MELVRLMLPPLPRHAATARVVAASVAADAGFDIDDIDDLRLAVNEAVAVLTDGDILDDTGSQDTGPISNDDMLDIEFRSAPRHVDVILRRTGSVTVTELDQLAHIILSAVVDRHEYSAGVFYLTKTSASGDNIAR